MSATPADGFFMHLFRDSVLAGLLCVLPLALGGDRAAAAFACGMFDGKFQCKAAPGGVAHGKNATPGVESESPAESPQDTTGGAWQGTTNPPAGTDGAGNGGQGTQTVAPGEHSCPPGYRVLAAPGKYGYCEPPEGTAEAISAGCQHGMVGTPPNCHCPRNSELLGGNCVHYSATCTTALAADAIPQPCQGAEEKLACKMRQDGLKDCCCLTYDKL
jgi:hypothetical protein